MVKKSFFKLLKNEIFQHNLTTLHGVNQLTSNKGRKFHAWLLAMACNIFMTLAFIIVVKKKYDSNLIYTQLDTSCRVNEAPFPTVSICNFNAVSVKASMTIYNILKHYNRNQTEIESFFKDLKYLTNYGEGSNEAGEYIEIMNILKHHYFNMDSVMQKVHQTCENLLMYCEYNRKQKKCVELFDIIKTLEGYCCAFNYVAIKNDIESPFKKHDVDMEYYDDDTDDNSASVSNIVANSEFGRLSGLFIIFNVEPNDYINKDEQLFFGAKIIISDPNDYPETSINYKHVLSGQSLDIKVEPMIFQCEEDIHKVDLEKRRCWFHDEPTLTNTDRYSYETCMTECRIKSFQHFCGCVPYKYPIEKFSPICELKDLKCVHNVLANRSRVECQPFCYMECRDKKYQIKEDIGYLQDNSDLSKIISKNNISELSSIRVYYDKPMCNCLKLTLLIDFDFLIATYGGVFSLSFGGSVLTLFELIYLFLLITIRTIWNYIKNYINRNNT